MFVLVQSFIEKSLWLQKKGALVLMNLLQTPLRIILQQNVKSIFITMKQNMLRNWQRVLSLILGRNPIWGVQDGKRI